MASAQQSGNGAPTNPINFLIAAASAAKQGQVGGAESLGSPQRSMPKGAASNLPATRKSAPKSLKVIK